MFTKEDKNIASTIKALVETNIILTKQKLGDG